MDALLRSVKRKVNPEHVLGAAGSLLEAAKAPERKMGSARRHERTIPTHFVAVRLANKELWGELDAVGREIGESERGMSRLLVPGADAHLTMCVLAVKDEKDTSKKFESLESRMHSLIPSPPLVHVHGIGSFGSKVVFAKVEDGEEMGQLRRVVGLLEEELQEESIRREDGSDPKSSWSPHITIAKVSKGRGRRGVPKAIPKSTWDSFIDQEFGSIRISSVDLLDMRNRGPDGFYRVVSSILL